MESKQEKKRDGALDGLRGLAALAVLWNHLGLESVGGVTAPTWTLWLADGTAAVMIFFVLSGYVIGLTTPFAAGPKDVGRYARKRVLRLLPLNLVGVLLACLATASIPWRTVVGNALFLENFVSYAGLSIPVIPGNENLWSLNYEALYYLLFAGIWWWQPALTKVAVVSFLVMVVGWYTSWLPLFLACYAAGFLFWLGGLGLAWHAKPAAEENSNWPSCVLLLLVTWKLRVALNLLVGLPVPIFDGPVARLYNLDTLPACIWLLALVARRQLPGLRWIQWWCVVVPLVGLIIKWYRPGYFTPGDYQWAMGGYLASLLLWRWRPSLRFFRVCAPLGAIAYGLYVVSRPIQLMVFSHAQWLPQNAGGYALGVVLTVVLAFSLAWWLERQLQPALTAIFLPKKVK